MKAFHELFRKVVSSRHFDLMLRMVKPLEDHIGINHFWYYKVTTSGFYTYLGSHIEWSEYCLENHLIDQFPCLRHPDLLPEGVGLMKSSTGSGYQKLLSSAWEKFQINFNLNLIKKTEDGIEAFGFGTKSNSPFMDQYLINELPFLLEFIRAFRKKNQKILDLVDSSQVNFLSYLGDKFYEEEKFPVFPKSREKLLKTLNLHPPFPLTSREKEVLKHLSSGFSSSYIAKEMRIAFRTVENYTASAKSKLHVDSKTELIQKAQELKNLGCLD